ncbi:MAG: biotin/lipoyl-containing protein [Bacteroidota bacterium]
MPTYRVKIEEKSYEVHSEDLESLDLIQLDASHFHLLANNTSFAITVEEKDFSYRKLRVKVNENTYDMELTDEIDALVKQLGFSLGSTQQVKTIQAPMPGLILEILVEQGQAVEKGTPLLILEAMKMENVLKAEGEGIVNVIGAHKGESVDKGQVLIEME